MQRTRGCSCVAVHGVVSAIECHRITCQDNVQLVAAVLARKAKREAPEGAAEDERPGRPSGKSFGCGFNARARCPCERTRQSRVRRQLRAALQKTP